MSERLCEQIIENLIGLDKNERKLRALSWYGSLEFVITYTFSTFQWTKNPVNDIAIMTKF